MPIYEYACQECHSDFELLVRSDTVLECPHCHSTELDKKLSVFATASTAEAVPAAAGACASCPGAQGGCAFG